MNMMTNTFAVPIEESFILCLDDDRDFLDSMRIALPSKLRNERNYNIIFMDNPFETLELIRELIDAEEEIALLMTDQMMPKMRGIEFLKEAMAITPNSMRVLLTGHAGMDSAVTAINDNVLDKYLTKPVQDIDDLAFTLKRLLSEFDLKSQVNAQERVILDLYEFSNSLNRCHDLKDILNKTINFTSATLDCARISILLMEDDYLCYKAGMGVPKEISSGIRIPLGEFVAGHVVETRSPMLVSDVEKLSWWGKKIDSKYKSFISAPVVSAELTSFDQPLGVINVTNKRGDREFTNEDLQTLTFITNTASIAINNQLNRKKIEQNYIETISALIVALEARDPYTKGHSVRVRDYAVEIAKEMALDNEMIKTLSDAGMLHDIGKIGIRDDILLKPGKLDPQEIAEIRKHPIISSAIVRSISSLKEGATIVEQHHEKFDGSGYPKGIKQDAIHIGARIMAVADAFDAMTSNRPYRKGLSTKFALAELREKSGTQFDPNCVQAFEQCLHRVQPEEETEPAEIKL